MKDEKENENHQRKVLLRNVSLQNQEKERRTKHPFLQVASFSFILFDILDETPIVDIDGEEIIGGEPVPQWLLEDFDDFLEYEEPLEHFLKINSAEEYGSKTRHTKGETVNFELQNVEDAIRPDRLLERVFEHLIERVVGKRKARFIGVEVMNERMDKPYHIPMRPPEQNSPSAIAQAFEQLSQSDAELNLYGGQLQCKIFAVWLPSGSCANDGVHKRRRGLRSLVRVVNPHDRWCMTRSVAIGMAYYRIGKTNKEQFKQFCQEENELQRKKAKRLLTGAGLSKKKMTYDLQDVKAVQEFLDKTYGPKTFQIAVFSREHNNTILWKKPITSRYPLYLYLENGHYNFISKPWQLMNANDFCLDCERPVYPGQYHPRRCPSACKRCLRHGYGFPCKRKPGGRPMKCKKCLFIFENENCYRFHKELRGKQKRTICQKRYVCKTCNVVVITRAGPHLCRNRKRDAVPHSFNCRKCGATHDKDHRYCYIQPIEKVDRTKIKRRITVEQKDKRYIYFDTETTQSELIKVNGRNAYKHRVNVLVAQVLCEKCLEAGVDVKEPITRANRPIGCFCGVGRGRFRTRTLVFDSWSRQDADPVEDFLEWLLHSGSASGTVTILLSHNGGKFDIHLCLERLYLMNIAVKPVMTGLKIYSLEIKGRHVRHSIFKDTLNFFYAPLAKLPKAFDVNVEPKLYFPYLWNREENLFLELDHLPEKKYYQPDHMKPEERTKFLEWHSKNKNRKKFTLSKELVKYCINDVDIERLVSLKFDQMCREMFDVEPFVVAGTLAKLALHIYRRHYLPPNLMINAPEGGFRRHELQSAIALKYMRLFEQQHNVQVQTRNWSMGEARFGDGTGRRLDGFVDRGPKKKPLAIEFLGCYFHG